MCKINVEIKCLPGDQCIARNYRRKPADWENGVCRSVSVGIRNDKSYHVSYEVLLDRKTTGRSRMFREGGAPLFITVGDEAISKAKY
jgi:hypothetical protein